MQRLASDGGYSAHGRSPAGSRWKPGTELEGMMLDGDQPVMSSPVAVKCDDCGRIMSTKPGSGGTWAHQYDMAGMSLDHTHLRCKACSEKLGAATSNARPWDGDMSAYQGAV